MQVPRTIASNGLPRDAPFGSSRIALGSVTMTLLLVSNRLPVTLKRVGDRLDVRVNPGGVAAGLATFYREHGARWFGWPGDVAPSESREIATRLAKEFDCHPVFLSKHLARSFYAGFSNGTLWPLFHSFSTYARYSASEWAAYREVNERFADEVAHALRPDDVVWIHDYQLLLVPQMIRERVPDARIGFFLHIPFPPYDVFRLLPWHRELLRGVLGADLVGFHTYDYMRTFVGSVRRGLGYESRIGTITAEHRVVQADVFPLGIDVETFASAPVGPAAVSSIARLRKALGSSKLVFSISRLDYTKGIPEQLEAFGRFLESHPEWRRKVAYVLAVVPARERVAEYARLKREIDERVGRINSRYGTLAWTPIRYLYRQLDFEELLGLYRASDVALITPLRDGRNHLEQDGYDVDRPPRGARREPERCGRDRERDRPGADDARRGAGGPHPGDAGPPPTIRRKDLGDAVPRTSRRRRPALPGPRRQATLCREPGSDPPSVPQRKEASPPPRLRRHPRPVLHRSRCRPPRPAGCPNPQGPRVRLRKSCRVGEWPLPPGSGPVVRRDPHHPDRRARRMGTRPHGPRVEGDALRGRGVEGSSAAVHRSLRRAAARLRRRREGLLARMALPFGRHRDGDGRGEGARRRLDVAHREPRPAGPLRESCRRNSPRWGEQGHVLRDSSCAGAVGLPACGGRRLDRRGDVRGPPAHGVFGPRRCRSVRRPLQRGERPGCHRAPRIPDEATAVTTHTIGSRTGRGVELRRAPLGPAPRDPVCRRRRQRGR